MDRRDAIRSAILSATGLAAGEATAQVVAAPSAAGERLIGVLHIDVKLTAPALAEVTKRIGEAAEAFGAKIIVIPPGMRLSFYRGEAEATPVDPVS